MRYSALSSIYVRKCALLGVGRGVMGPHVSELKNRPGT